MRACVRARARVCVCVCRGNGFVDADVGGAGWLAGGDHARMQRHRNRGRSSVSNQRSQVIMCVCKFLVSFLCDLPNNAPLETASALTAPGKFCQSFRSNFEVS